MNNIIANFDQILKLAAAYNLPLSKKRGILREYLQIKTLELLYQEKLTKNIFFVGGTSLRILRGLDRFSEDLDFDFEKLEFARIDNLMNKLTKKLIQENLKIDFLKKASGRRRYYELRFKGLLYGLGISKHEGEKLRVKFDFENIWRSHNREVILLDKYGFLVNVVSIPLGQLLVQKLTAYTRRKQTQPRDIYDIIWLTSHSRKIDWEFAKKNNVATGLLNKAFARFASEKGLLATYKRKLRPFLIEERNVEKLDFFPKMLEKLRKHTA